MEEQIFEEKPIDLLEYWKVIKRRKWLIITFLSIVFTVTTIATFTKKPLYKSKGILLIEREANILSFQDIFQIETYSEYYYQTQFKLLQSRSLARDVIEKLKLNENPAFTGKKKNKNSNPSNLNSDPYSPYISSFLANLEVKPVRLTRLVEVSYKSRDPVLSANVVNTLFDSFIERDIQAKYKATAEATEFLSKQIDDLKREIEQGERKLQEYGAQKNIIALSEKETTVVEKLAELNRALTEAQIERVKKEVYYNEIKNATPDSLPEVMKNPVIKTLQEDYLRLSREYTKKSEIFKPDYPEMIRLRAELENARKALENEVINIVKGAYSDYQAALKKEYSLRQAFDAQKSEAIQLNSNAILYNSLKIEIENKRNLLENLLRRQAETDITARLRGLKTSGIRVVDRAEIPSSPFSPNKKLNMLLALLIGLFGGVGLAFFVEYLDRTIKTAEDVEKILSLPFLGFIPNFDPKKSVNSYGYRYHYGRKEKKEGKSSFVLTPHSVERISHILPDSFISESFRNLRTSLLLSPSDRDNKVFVISSCVVGEGKTTICANLSIVLSQMGKRVALVDGDLYNPSLHRVFSVKNIDGLTHFLTGGIEGKNLIKEITEFPGLFIINSGITPPNPAELISSSKMLKLVGFLKEKFDFIIIDSPPLLLRTDAYILSTNADGLILVINSLKTPRDLILKAKKELESKNIRVKGVVLNRGDIEFHTYYKYSYKYSYPKSQIIQEK